MRRSLPRSVLAFAALAVVLALGGFFLMHHMATASRIDWQGQVDEASRLARNHTELVGTYAPVGSPEVLVLGESGQSIELAGDGTFLHKVWSWPEHFEYDAYHRLQEYRGLWFRESDGLRLVPKETALARRLEVRTEGGVCDLVESTVTWRRVR